MKNYSKLSLIPLSKISFNGVKYCAGNRLIQACESVNPSVNYFAIDLKIAPTKRKESERNSSNAHTLISNNNH